MRLAATLAAIALSFTALPHDAAAQDANALNRAEIRAAVGELATLMEDNYVFPDVARQYGEALRRNARAGAYDALTDMSALTARLTSDLNTVHHDAHLRVGLSEAQQRRQGGGPSGPRGPAFGNDRWIADGVAYFRINGFPGGEDARREMAAVLDRYAAANTLIIDLRACPGGALDAMDVLFSRVYAQPTELLTMDTRTGANADLEGYFNSSPWLRRAANPPAGITRWVHWATPEPGSDLADARIYLLTGRTGSACEHMSLAMKQSGRATLVGGTTGGAGHYGGERTFANDRMQVWLPVGQTYVASTRQGWEGTGVTPNRAVAPADALNVVLAELGLPAEEAVAPTPAAQIVEAAPRNRRYGIMMEPPAPNAPFIAVENTAEGSIARGAGLRAGDRIVAMNGTPLAQIADITPYMRNTPLTLSVERGSERVEVRMALD